jgi:8-amino-7-oxononanoate synthase
VDLSHLQEGLRQLARAGLLRAADDGAARAEASAAAAAAGRSLIDLSSNDYLGLGAELVSRETLDSLVGLRTGSAASRLLHGTHAPTAALESRLAAWVAQPKALLFSSGYALNTSVLPALAGAGDAIFSDALNHASVIDGCRLSRASVHVYPHCDLDALAVLLERSSAEQRVVVTESYFSMDGDGPDLARLAALCRRHRAVLYVDEAHALGVFGPEGAGRCRAVGVTADVVVGTLGKAVGTQGAFAAGSATLRDWLWNRARGFVFSTASSPLLAALTLANVEQARRADPARATLQRLATYFRRELARRGLPSLPSFGPIVPVPVASAAAGAELCGALRRAGVLAEVVRPPTVPSCRLRLVLHARLTESDVDYALDQLLAALPP